MALHVRVTSPAGEVWTDEATQIPIPLINGELGTLLSRRPLMTVLGVSLVRLSPIDGGMCNIKVPDGFYSMDHDIITITADHVKQSTEA